MNTIINKKNIWNFAQNRPILIARDLAELVPINVTFEVLLKRGVFKWFSVRRDLIKLKNIWKGTITQTIQKIVVAKQNKNKIRHAYLKGYLAAYQECRRDVRKLCHSDRWRAPDNDKYSIRFLAELEKGNEIIIFSDE